MFEKFKEIYNELDFTNEDILNTGNEIIKKCEDKNIIISKTGDNEIIIYTKKDNGFYNLIIDEDNDISFIYIGYKIGDSKVEFFHEQKSFDFDYICSLI